MVGFPPDSHVHSQWSWDAPGGSMADSCAQAIRLGLPAIAFTEHVDSTVWAAALDDLDADHPVVVFSDADGRVTPPALDITGYLDSIERCRELFPDLRIVSGVELGEPHWHAVALDNVLAAGDFDLILGSLHSLPDGDTFQEPPGLFRCRQPDEVIRRYLHEVAQLVTQSNAFSVLAHIDYPLRYWNDVRYGRFDLAAYEDDFRYALHATADSGRALEISTVLPMQPTILRWWHEEGGQAVTFGSDAHDPSEVARNFHDAVRIAEAGGFRPGADPYELWSR